MKPISIMEAALARRLRSRRDLLDQGVTVERFAEGGIALLQPDGVVGIWRWKPDATVFEFEYQDRTVTAHTIMAAVALTASILIDGDE